MTVNAVRLVKIFDLDYSLAYGFTLHIVISNIIFLENLLLFISPINLYFLLRSKL